MTAPPRHILLRSSRRFNFSHFATFYSLYTIQYWYVATSICQGGNKPRAPVLSLEAYRRQIVVTYILYGVLCKNA